MKKIKEALHLGHTNVPPSAAQTSAAPTSVAASSASTVPGTGLGTQPVLGTAPTSTLGTTSNMLSGTGAPLGATPLGGAPLGTTSTLGTTASNMLSGAGLGAAPLGTTGSTLGTAGAAALGAGALGGTGAGLGTGLGSTTGTMGAPLGTTGPMGTGYGTTTTTTSGTTGLAQGPLREPYLSSASTMQPGYASGGITSTAGSMSTGSVVTTETTVVEQDRFIPGTAAVETRVAEAPVTHMHVQPAVIEHKERAPVVQEVIKPGLREEIQPVIHRDREQLEIREEIQPIYEKSVQPTIVEERQLAPEFRPEVRTGAMPVIAEGPKQSVFVEQEHLETFVKPTIVEETVHKKIIEEVQPVIHRETIQPRLIREVQPIYEKVIEAPVVTYETLPARYTTATTIAAAPAPIPALREEQVITTTTVEKQFIPGTTATTFTGARTGAQGAPYSSAVPGGAAYSTGMAPVNAPLSSTTTSLGTQGAPVTEFKELRIEEKTLQQPGSFQQAPSTFQRY